jgi:DinB superfamily
MQIRTDRLGLLLDQLQSSREISAARLEGLTDEEYRWEPALGAWSVRRRAEAVTPLAYGAGEWVLDHEAPQPVPAPVTTIAWRLGHLYAGFSGRWEWTFGGREQGRETIEFTPTAAVALERFWALLDRWQASVGAMTDEQLDVPGFGQYPHGLDPHLPFIGIVWWTNREFIHHMAEVALLRDLWAARGGAG